MYESYFRLSCRPFRAAPHADVYIPTGGQEQARQTLIRCLDRAEGLAFVVGPAGTGKSLLGHVLAKHFRERFCIAFLAGARLSTRRALLQNILFELKLPYRELDEAELRLSLIDHLQPRSGGPEGLLLIVDEAHALPLRLLEEIRLLTNLVHGGQSRVRLILIGAMRLEERLANPKLDSFQQRIGARCYLQSFGRDETIYYVQEQVRRAGGVADHLFTAEAQAAIHTSTDGVPRLINQLGDHALMLAALGGQRQIDAAGIEEAWADLQQLPLPSSAGSRPIHGDRVTSGGIVEFGELADESSANPEAGRPTIGSAAVAALDKISDGIDSLEADSLDACGRHTVVEFSPAAEGGTEVELIFHDAHDPFGGQWDEEEVVIDRYALLESASSRARRLSGEQPASISDVNPLELESITAVTDQACPDIAAKPAASASSVLVGEKQPQVSSSPSRQRPSAYRQLFSKLRSK
jgi:type II secretory pathway predicted ATPase ExeA